MKKFMIISVLALLGLMTACDNEIPDMPSKHKKIELTEPGSLSDVFNFESDYRNAEALVIEGEINEWDVGAILSISARSRLRHVDLSNATIEGNTMSLLYIPPMVNSLSHNAPDADNSMVYTKREADLTRPAEFKYLKLPNTLEELKIDGNYIKITKIILPASLKKITDMSGTTLNEVHSLAQTPPECSEHTFASGTTLYVPKGCRQAYAKATGWNVFTKIKEID